MKYSQQHVILIRCATVLNSRKNYEANRECASHRAVLGTVCLTSWILYMQSPPQWQGQKTGTECAVIPMMGEPAHLV